jgi:hypothetical protein
VLLLLIGRVLRLLRKRRRRDRKVASPRGNRRLRP